MLRWLEMNGAANSNVVLPGGLANGSFVVGAFVSVRRKVKEKRISLYQTRSDADVF